MSSILSVLKNATQPLHDKLEAVSFGKAILSKTLTLPQYQELILRNSIIYQKLEPSVNAALMSLQNERLFQFQSERLPDLYKDLSYFASQNLSVQRMSFPDFFNVSFHELMGILYVMEGSRLGGNVVLKALNNNDHLREIPDFNFYAQPNIEVRTRWMTFVKIANEQLTNEKLTATIRGATKTFQFYTRIFEQPLI